MFPPRRSQPIEQFLALLNFHVFLNRENWNTNKKSYLIYYEVFPKTRKFRVATRETSKLSCTEQAIHGVLIIFP